MKKIHFPDDCLELQKRLLGINYYADLAEVQCFWQWRSEQWDAGCVVTDWLPVHEQDRGERLKELVFEYSVRDEVF